MNKLSLDSSSSWDHIRIGVTTQEEIQGLFGRPTDIQISSAGSVGHETWAYVSAYTTRQPFQYLPFWGALRLITSSDHKAFAVSFSQEGIVDGLTVSEIQAQGDDAYRLIAFDSDSARLLYGTKNPLAQNVSPDNVSALEN